MTTTSGLFAVPNSPGLLGADAVTVSDAARAATLAQNRAGATRLEAAYLLVEEFARAAQEKEFAGAGADACADAPKRSGFSRLDPQARVRDHLVAACQLTCWHASRLVTAGVQLHTRLLRLRSAVEQGLVPEQLAIDLACRLAEVPDPIVGDVEDEIVAGIVDDLAGGDRPSRNSMDSRIDEAVERHAPEGAEKAVEEAVKARLVRFRGDRNGMASLWAKLPLADAELLRQRIEADARAAFDDGMLGTMDQLRADALASLAVYTSAGVGAGTDGCADVSVETEGGIELGEVRAGADLPRPSLGNAAGAGQAIRISVIAAAARGLPNRVEFVHGAYSSFDWLCRELLNGEDAKVRFEVIDPAPGALDSPELALRYVLAPTLAERIRLRDGTCRHPGCTVAARDCDIDHVIAFDHDRPELGGPSMEWNLMCLCRKHHLEKTFGTNAYRPGPLGELVITTDTGHRHRTKPRGPLARARDGIRDQAMDAYVDRLISPDGYINNPPGASRVRPHERPA